MRISTPWRRGGPSRWRSSCRKGWYPTAMRVQILGGCWRGRPVAVPKVAGLRPTSQKVRKALYDILGARVVGASVLDLFAGTGALGLEAVSRSARSVVFVEREPACTQAIRKTLEAFGLPPAVTAEVLTVDAFAAVKRFAKGHRRFDLILMDPPYGGHEGRKALQGVACSAILSPSGLVVIEQARRSALPEAVGLWQERVAHYGDTELAFYRPTTESPP